MPFKVSTATLLIGTCAAALCAGALVSLEAQQAAPGGRGGGRGGPAAGVFTAADSNKDGFITRDELKAAFAKWLSDGDTGKTGSVTQDQLAVVVNAAMPQPAAPAGGRGAAAPPRPHRSQLRRKLPAARAAAAKSARLPTVRRVASPCSTRCLQG